MSRPFKATLIAGALTFAFAAVMGAMVGAFMLAEKLLGKLGPLALVLLMIFAAVWICASLDLRDQEDRTLSQGGKK